MPDEFNRQLFGPGAKRSTELYTKAYDDEKLVGLLMLFVSTDRIIHSFKVKKALCYGYDDQGREVVKVPLKEPIVVRKAYDRQSDVHRISVS